MKRSSTVAEKRHMQRVAEMGCIVCSHIYDHKDTPAQVHHVRVNHGWGRSSHFMTIPLCVEHHTGKTGVHSMGRDEFESLHGYSELRLLEIVQDKLGVN
ncbi:Ref family recombination enhancement nuclease [Undibacterium baiyunense]|uniref:Recombination enhancement, RecA-dependent nuclease n=1 Tax=Undibacterium baiyunense TaxID=2828731 RepID=A0A941DH23_9BURK|nr:Ref family recombination enhancement nuclease [Undibacterium baiyunense]MBR7747435.1 hypothetical protein [Undibacterium baiyunense]